MITFLISHRNHLNHLETVQMRGHKVCFYAELTKIIPNYHKYSLLFRALGIIVLFFLFSFYGQKDENSSNKTSRFNSF